MHVEHRLRSAMAETAPMQESENILQRSTETAMGPPRPLRYAASPLERGTTQGGITAAENAVVRHLSAGRVDLHAIGATVQRVPGSDPRLRAVGARSLAQGRRALVSDTADRGHEIWHLAQQAMGQVTATGSIGGQSVNTSPRLEADADRMGAAISRQASSFSAATSFTDAGPALASAAMPAMGDAAPIQRKVTLFSATTSSRLPPIADLLKIIDYDKFDEDEDDVYDHIIDSTNNPKKTLTVTPKQIKASVSPNGFGNKPLARTTYKSGVVGKIGADNYFLHSAIHEVFEGGHLIPHELWSDGDPQKNSADDYVNLVPMSRTMNVGRNEHSWRDQEKKMLDYYEKGNSFKVTVDVNSPIAHEFTYDQLGRVFNLDVVDGEENETVNVYNWLPEKVDIAEDKNLFTFTTAYENQIYDVHGKIMDGAALIAVLKQTPIWERCDSSLQEELEDI